MQAEDVVYLYNLLEANDVVLCIDGGWGIDALLGRQTRSHNDLDIAVEHKNIEKLRSILGEIGYKEITTGDRKDYNFVLEDHHGRKIDVHSYTFDAEGNNVYGIEYPIEALTGTGIINSKTVSCIALEYVIRFHENYEPDETDIKDIQALIDQFGIKPPRNYKILS